MRMLRTTTAPEKKIVTAHTPITRHQPRVVSVDARSFEQGLTSPTWDDYWRASKTSDVVDAHVLISAWHALRHAITSDPDDLRALVPAVRFVTI
jgi:hypothetical protein